jgi:transcriptional regulator with XRE-family HTH domain
MIKVMDGFGSRFKEALELAEVTKADVARAIGCSPSALQKWEEDHHEVAHVRSDLIFPAARFMRVDVEWLVTGKGHPRPPPGSDRLTHDAEDFAKDYEQLKPEHRMALRLLAGSLKSS